MLRDKTTIKLALMILLMLFVQPYVAVSITDGVVDAAFAQMASNVTLADDASTETSLAYFSKYFNTSANEGARACENEGQWGCDPLWDPKPQILFVQAKPGYSKSEPKCASILAELRRTEV